MMGEKQQRKGHGLDWTEVLVEDRHGTFELVQIVCEEVSQVCR